MPLKYIYKMNGNFINKKDIEKFADETTGYCEEKWGDSYLEKSFDEKVNYCNSKCENNLNDNYKQKMTNDGREFKDCMPVDGNKCLFNFSITNSELSNMGETSLEEPENYTSPDRTEDCKLKTDLEYRKKTDKTNKKGIDTKNEMSEKEIVIEDKIYIKNETVKKNIDERKKAVGFSIQGGIDRIFNNAFEGVWQRETFSDLSNNEVSYTVVAFITIVFLLKIFEIIFKFCNSKQNI